ncbi:RNA polymerase sigma-70 factor [Hahella ganghwensis]|uniref:RNA polymerase sigma-70 factor n=1 Tax=Hahella ganghwensis TaxID=286420 RepID=UPI00037C0D1B|nr:RNA polymerase sigma-70 factor [Hahella ganghwensis]
MRINSEVSGHSTERTDHHLLFEEQRSLLFAIAYRMTGSVVETEDILQDAYLRWHDVDLSSLESPAAYLKTIVSRLSIDHLRRDKNRQEYIGPWLPEPLAQPEPELPCPAERTELYQSLSMAFMHLLEKLTPVERAVFVLREAFGFDHLEVSRIVEKSTANCRQIERRARQALKLDRSRFEAPTDQHQALLSEFVSALAGGDDKKLLSILAEDAILYSDGGGKVLATIRPLYGAERILELVRMVRRRTTPENRFCIREVNGEPAVLLYDGDEIESCIHLAWSGNKVSNVYVVRNPDKLKGLMAE